MNQGQGGEVAVFSDHQGVQTFFVIGTYKDSGELPGSYNVREIPRSPCP